MKPRNSFVPVAGKTAAPFLTILLSLCIARASCAQTVAEQLNSGRLSMVRAEASNVDISAVIDTITGRSDLNTALPGLQHTAVVDMTGDFTAVDAKAWILRAAANSRVLMFNENHYEPQARVFVRSLLPALRRAGFTHIGFEAFQPGTVPHAYQSFPGYYVVEPTFAALLHESTSLGFVVFGYEATRFGGQNASMQETIAVREQSEAENLAAAIHSFPERSKVIIFAGWSHIAEKPLEDGLGPQKTMWMAAKFSGATGIDPFTVDLTNCAYEVSTLKHHGGRVRLKADGSCSVIGSYADAVDAQVCLPMAAKSYPDPASFYRRTLGKPLAIPHSLIRRSEEVLVQAYSDRWQQNAIAYDRVLVRPGEHLNLYVPPGSYELVSHLADGTLVGTAVVKVNARQ